MEHRTPKRIYSARALESWFEKLSGGWEKDFSDEALALGRALYKRDEVRTLELTDQSASVHARRAEVDCYAMLDWPKNGKLAVRCSIAHETYGNALAAAGLYEIEELVSEEVSALPGEEAPKKKEAAPKKEAPKAPAVSPARKLRLKFEPLPSGLVIDVYWEGAGKTVQALSPLNGKEEVTPPEREKLIRLASLARKSGFHLLADKGRYQTEGYDRVPEFIVHELEGWRKYFDIEDCEEFQYLSRGVADVGVAGKAVSCGADHLKLDWTLSIGRERLNVAEGKKLLRQPDLPVYLKGRGLVRLPSERAQWLLDWKDILKNPLSGILPNYMLFSLFGQSAFKMQVSKELTTWREALSQDPAEDDRVLPEFLRPYQKQGVRWMRHLLLHGCHALLADEMGLGKTVQILSLLRAYAIEDSPSLIVCPASVVPVWRAEIERFFPGTAVEVLKSGHDFVETKGSHLWISSYTQLRRHKSLLDKVEFGYVVLDEAQFIKNPEAKVTQACQCLKSRHRVALTGTPLENRYLDVWTLFRFLMPGLLGIRRHFEAALDMHAAEALADRIRAQIAPFVLRRTKRDVARELPPKVEVDLMCPMTDLQREEYQRLSAEGLQSLGPNINEAVRQRSMGFLTLLTRLRQVSCDPNLLPWVDTDLCQSGKLNALSEKLSEVLASGHKVVIFSQFVTLLNRVRKLLDERFAHIPVYELTGQTVDRAVPVSTFQNKDGAACILVSLRAGGTGITLHAADYVFLLDPWWNPAVEEQAIDRVHRIGQDRTVFVYRMIAAGGIEERIQQLKAAKRSQFDRVVGKLIDVSDFGNYFRSLNDLIELIPTADEANSDQAALAEASALPEPESNAEEYYADDDDAQDEASAEETLDTQTVSL